MRTLTFIGMMCLGAAAWPLPAQSKVYLKHQQALTLAFPPLTVAERRSVFLTPDQMKEIEKAAGVKVSSKIVTYYRGVDKTGQVTGYAFFDSHIVRTKAETFMVVLKPDGAIAFVEILAFDEPEEYKPGRGWIDQFKGKTLGEELRVRRGLANIAGATLTSLALTDGVRRIVATWPIVKEEEAKEILKPSKKN